MKNSKKKHTKKHSLTPTRIPKFKGWDWTEVYDALKLKFPKEPKELIGLKGEELIKAVEDSDKAQYKPLRDLIRETHKTGFDLSAQEVVTKEGIRVVKVCRAYTKAVAKAAKNWHYEAPLWKGLSEIENDWTFLTYFSELFPAMWT